MRKTIQARRPFAGLTTRNLIVAGLSLTAALFSVSQAAAIEITKPKAVVELFTSQGCSSCPAADRALSEFNAEGEILGLSLHVDYWDRLGWKDTFASPAHTKRQWAYARALGERQVYTPQAIVNGRSHLVGSRKNDIADMAEAYSQSDMGLTVPVNVEKRGNALHISVPTNEVSENATLYAYYFNPSAEVTIDRGENRGKTITYSNVVRKVDMIGMVGGTEMTTTFSKADLKRKGFTACALVLQTNTYDGQPGPIIGATVISDL